MAVPKSKKSKSRRDMRRAHYNLDVPGMTACDECGELRLPHHVCKVCGSYKGREVIKQS